MVKAILKFIENKFTLMPKSIQVFTFLTFVGLLIYIITLPRFIDMKLVSIFQGEEFPIKDAEIQVEVSGRVIRLLTDTNGRFSVPISTVLPTSNITFVLNPDPSSASIKEVEIPVTNSYMSRSKLTFDVNTATYQITPEGVTSYIGNMLVFISIFNSAYANENNTMTLMQAEETTLKVISDISGLEIGNISPEDRLQNDLKLDNIDLSYLSAKLEKGNGLDLWPVLKNPNTTVNQLIEALSEQDIFTSSIADTNGVVGNIERRNKFFLINERNTSCQRPQKLLLTVRADDEWKIDVKSIKPKVTVSALSNFTGIKQKSPEGFVVTGKVINSGRCLRIFGQRMHKDIRGTIQGRIEYEEYRTID